MGGVRIATLGAATLDVFLSGAALTAKCDPQRGCYEEFALGEKIELEDVHYTTGGGATNAAVTFARQGLATTVYAKVGDDLGGQSVIKQLKSEGCDASQVAVDINKHTGYSTMLLAPNGERTVLVYRGVSEQLQPRDFKLDQLAAGWLYISSLAGNYEFLEAVLAAASKQNIKVAFDPGSKELQNKQRLLKLLPKLTLLKGNKQEISHLVSGESAAELVKSFSKLVPYIVVSDGAQGSWVGDGQQLYQAGLYKDVKVVDRTGAGDAFGSGLVAMLAQGKTIEEAITFGSANSTSVVEEVGAKSGILHRHDKIDAMPIKVSPL